MTDVRGVMTADELARLPGDPRSELVTGVLRVSEPTGGVHGRVAMRLGYRLHAFVEAHGLGVVLPDVGYILARAPDTVRAPDLSFVPAGYLPIGIPDGFLPFAPALAIEIRSPGARSNELNEKAADCFRAGTRLVWIVDPAARLVTVLRQDGSVTTLSGTDWLEGEDVVPGFRCRVGEILADPVD